MQTLCLPRQPMPVLKQGELGESKEAKFVWFTRHKSFKNTNGLWSVHTMEYYSGFKRNEVLTHATT